MKKLHEHINRWSSAIENRWKLIPSLKQRKYVVIVFTIYLLITIGAMVLAWHEGQGVRKRDTNKIEHITNPLKKESKTGLKVIHSSNIYQLFI